MGARINSQTDSEHKNKNAEGNSTLCLHYSSENYVSHTEFSHRYIELRNPSSVTTFEFNNNSRNTGHISVSTHHYQSNEKPVSNPSERGTGWHSFNI